MVHTRLGFDAELRHQLSSRRSHNKYTSRCSAILLCIHYSVQSHYYPGTVPSCCHVDISTVSRPRQGEKRARKQRKRTQGSHSFGLIYGNSNFIQKRYLWYTKTQSLDHGGRPVPRPAWWSASSPPTSTVQELERIDLTFWLFLRTKQGRSSETPIVPHAMIMCRAVPFLFVSILFAAPHL